jgi:hypothetical protein
MVAIEFGMWRLGRNGGSSGFVTVGNGRLREQRGAIVAKLYFAPQNRDFPTETGTGFG